MKWMLLSLFLTLSAMLSAADEPAKVVKDGKLSAPFGDDKTIVAVLHVEDPNAALEKGKVKKKKKDSAPASESISLVASGDIATKLKDFIDKNARVEVTGTTVNGKMTVADVMELPAPDAKKKKKK